MVGKELFTPGRFFIKDAKTGEIIKYFNTYSDAMDGYTKGVEMTDKETLKCHWCKKKLTTDNIVISSSKWAYCKECKRPMLDMLIQPPEHFLKRHENEIEHDTDIHLMMRGFI